MDKQENDMMTRAGPGTPAGETLRRYWLPVSFSHEIKSDEPKIVLRSSTRRKSISSPAWKNTKTRSTTSALGWRR